MSVSRFFFASLVAGEVLLSGMSGALGEDSKLRSGVGLPAVNGQSGSKPTILPSFRFVLNRALSDKLTRIIGINEGEGTPSGLPVVVEMSSCQTLRVIALQDPFFHRDRGGAKAVLRTGTELVYHADTSLSMTKWLINSPELRETVSEGITDIWSSGGFEAPNGVTFKSNYSLAEFKEVMNEVLEVIKASVPEPNKEAACLLSSAPNHRGVAHG